MLLWVNCNKIILKLSSAIRKLTLLAEFLGFITHNCYTYFAVFHSADSRVSNDILCNGISECLAVQHHEFNVLLLSEIVHTPGIFKTKKVPTTSYAWCIFHTNIPLLPLEVEFREFLS